MNLLQYWHKTVTKNARKAIYDRYEKNLNPDYEFVETPVLVILDGLKGLEFSVKVQGREMELDSTFWADDYLLEVCKEYYSESSPKEYLEEKSQDNKHIEAFLSSLEEINSLRSKEEMSRKCSLSQLLQLIDEGKNVPILAGKWLKHSDVLKIANLLLSEKCDTKIQSYLRLLSRAQYPLDISNLLPFLNSSNDNIKRLTLRILQKISDYRIRELIEVNYANLSYLFENIELFVSNFLEKDMDVLCHVLDTLKEEEEFHYFGCVVLDVFDKNLVKNSGRLLNKLYTVNNCSICRESFIKMLISTQELSDKILREMKYDCEPDIRNLANTYQAECNQGLPK